MSETPKRTSAAADYLDQAADALRDSGSAHALYGVERFSTAVHAQAIARMLARGKRLDFSRTSILFSAIAAEAYINAFIFDHFSQADREALDRLPTVEKYVIAPRLLPDGPRFDRGREPLTSLVELFDLRNALVHPKPELRLREPSETLPEEPHGFDRLNPDVAARLLVATATAAVELTAWPDGQGLDMKAAMFVHGRYKIRAYGRKARKAFPPIGAKGEESLAVQIIRADQKRTKRAGLGKSG